MVGIGVGLRQKVGARVRHHLVGIGHADDPVGAHQVRDVAAVDHPVHQEAIGRHDRFRHHRLRVDHVLDVPVIRIAAADPRQVRPGALRAPLERVVVHRLGRQAVVAVALDLVAHRADHLAVAVVAALADVDLAPGQLERAVGAHPLDFLDRVLEVEQRHDLHDPRRW
jgi:hypothetical protein